MDSDAAISRAVKAILERTHPIRIIVFGSVARGDAHPDSDIDLMVVVSDGTSTTAVNRSIRHVLIDPLVSFDVLVATESELAGWKSDGWRLYDEIARDGKVVYAA